MAEEKKGRGCFFYGCITLVIVVILAIIGLYFGTRFFINKLVNTYTSKTPVAVAPVKLPARDGGAVVKRVDDFTKALREGATVAPLELTSDELDYAVRNSPAGAALRDHAHLVITN